MVRLIDPDTELLTGAALAAHARERHAAGDITAAALLRVDAALRFAAAADAFRCRSTESSSTLVAVHAPAIACCRAAGLEARATARARGDGARALAWGAVRARAIVPRG
jgi:hypothetical protein